MATLNIIGIKDNERITLIPNQFIPSILGLTSTYQDLTPNQVINTQSVLNLGLWLGFNPAPGTNIDVKIKCYRSPLDLNYDPTYEDGFGVFSIKTISGVSQFTEQNYKLKVTESYKAVIQIPTADLVNNIKIFVKGYGDLVNVDLTSQARNFK